MTKLAVRPIISERRAREMFFCFINDSDLGHDAQMRGAPHHKIEAWFAEKNEPLHRLIPKLRLWSSTIPFVENLADGAWHVMAQYKTGISAEIIVDGVGSAGKIEGEGSIDIDYQAKFRSACAARDEAIEKCSTDALHTALSKGVSSIESYIFWRAFIWNEKFGIPRLDDSKGNKVAFEEKIREWVPIMANGRKLDLGEKIWSDFVSLQKIRDEEATHSKVLVQRTSPGLLVGPINLFRSGIAGLLLELHRIFGEPAKRSVIRATFYPDVYVDKN